jgi:hypothetical protein
MFKLIKDIGGLAGDALTIVEAPVRVAVNATRQVTKPVADALEEVADDLKDDR